MTWIARLFPPILHTTVGFQWCLLKFGNCFRMECEPSKKAGMFTLLLCFFLALQHFHWVSRIGKECLARKGEKKCCQGQGTQPRDSIHQLHGGPWPTHYLSWEAGGHLAPSTVLHGHPPGQTGPHGPRRDLRAQLPYRWPWRVCCQACHPEWHDLDQGSRKLPSDSEEPLE